MKWNKCIQTQTERYLCRRLFLHIPMNSHVSRTEDCTSRCWTRSSSTLARTTQHEHLSYPARWVYLQESQNPCHIWYFLSSSGPRIWTVNVWNLSSRSNFRFRIPNVLIILLRFDWSGFVKRKVVLYYPKPLNFQSSIRSIPFPSTQDQVWGQSGRSPNEFLFITQSSNLKWNCTYNSEMRN